MVARSMAWLERQDASTAFNQRVLFFFLVHIPIAAAIRTNSLVATAHALAVFVYGLQVATRRRSGDKLAYVLAYIAGSEILWRGGHARVFWEYGKYSATLLMLVHLATHGLSRRYASRSL